MRHYEINDTYVDKCDSRIALRFAEVINKFCDINVT